MTDVDDRAGRPRDLFAALADPLRAQISSGALALGVLMPSESRLARDAGVTRYSVRKALTLLHEEGLIAPVAGRGWVVTGNVAATSERLPMYRRIAATLRTAILGGQLTSGTAVPSESALVAEWGVSRATVRQGLALLESEGLIRTCPGSGRYVR